MIQVAIVEDEISAQDQVKACLSLLSKKQSVEFNITTFSTGSAFLEKFACQFDIVFMDIEMPGLNGMETAKLMRKKDSEVVLVFVTNLVQMALEGYQVEALDFIVKPIESASFLLKMERVLSRTLSLNKKSISLNNMSNETIIISHKDIFYVETDGHYVILHTSKGDIKSYATLKEIEGKIQDQRTFVRCNRSFLVNLQYLDRIEKDTVYIHGNPLLISRPSHKAFLMAVAAYIGG